MISYKNSVLYFFLILIVFSCAGKFYSTPNIGHIYVQVRAYASKEGIVCVNKIPIGKINEEGIVLDHAGKKIGQSRYQLIYKGNIKIRINVVASQDGTIYTSDSIVVGTINEKGKIYNLSGDKIGERKASLRELMEYYEENRVPYE